MRNRSRLVSPQKDSTNVTDVGRGHFGVLGADDVLEDREGSDDGQSSHSSLEEPWFDTDAEFSEGEPLERAPIWGSRGSRGQSRSTSWRSRRGSTGRRWKTGQKNHETDIAYEEAAGGA